MRTNTKGNAGEDEFVAVLEKHLCYKLKRDRNLIRALGADIFELKPFAIEIKRQENLQVKSWWEQAVSQATAENPIPVLAFRQNRRQWRILLPIDVCFKKKLIGKGGVGVEKHVEIDLETFLVIVDQIGKGQ